jgi:hypothetical protein
VRGRVLLRTSREGCSKPIRQEGRGVDRIRLIELIEAHAARLSAEGGGLWEELELLRESIPDPEDPTRMAREYDIMERIFELPVPQQFIISRLTELVGGLRAGEEAERRGESGEGHRARGVINSAMLRDREEGQPIDAHMTLGRAIARLEGHD